MKERITVGKIVEKTVFARGNIVPVWEGLPFTSNVSKKGELVVIEDWIAKSMFDLCTRAMQADQEGAAKMFEKLFWSESINLPVKEKALADMARIANETGEKMQEDGLEMVKRIDEVINGGHILDRASQRFGDKIGYAISVMSDEKPIRGRVNGQLASVVDFDIVMRERRKAISSQY
jgi:hypothetical protein